MNGTKLAGAVCPVDKNRRIRNRTYGGVGGRREQSRPLPDAQDRHLALAIDQRFALGRPNWPSAPDKKSRSMVSSPTLARRSRIWRSASSRPGVPFSNTSPACSGNCLRHVAICVVCTPWREPSSDNVESPRSEVWNNYVARWEKQGLPFFVKNLENVQGDERDVIFVSTTFGPPPGDTKPFQRFGPIGTATGWRRLNVLFTRARLALHVYTSLRPEDIIVDETTRRGTAEFRNYLEYARDGKIGAATTTGREPDSDFEVSVADLLRARDYDVVPQLGVAGFFIDLAVRNPHRPGEFLAGIECDGATYHSGATVRDRDRIREQILEDLGWRGKIYRIWSTDWFRNRAPETQKLLQFLDRRAAESEAAMAAVPTVTPKPKPSPPPTLPKRAEEIVKPPLVEEAADEKRYVEVGDIVTYEDSETLGKQLEVRIVDRAADKLSGEVNENAPLARALLDLTVGDESQFSTPPHGVHKIRVVRIEAPRP